MRQVYVSSGTWINTWDDGYPSGGNYWSDDTHETVDEKSGPKQDQPGSDGIADTPYIINDYNRDRYPLMTSLIPIPDTIPPITDVELAGEFGRENWFTSDVMVTLWADDNIAVEKTEYSFDNITWNNYVKPFNVTSEGQTIIYHRSMDKAGNVETAKAQTVKIDKTPPCRIYSNQQW